MTESKKIECPSCGASSVFKLSNSEYKCNYCQTNFVVNDDIKIPKPNPKPASIKINNGNSHIVSQCGFSLLVYITKYNHTITKISNCIPNFIKLETNTDKGTIKRGK